ncbi:MAG: metallophosphoesterase [Aquincola sp.]|nr:metallophosphoesterase [Aquincola sp.]
MRFWVIGDSGTGDQNARAVRDAYRAYAGATYTNLWLMLGDNAYSSGTDAQYQSAVFDIYPDLLRQSVLWPTLGNHDAVTAESANQTPFFSWRWQAGSLLMAPSTLSSSSSIGDSR